LAAGQILIRLAAFLFVSACSLPASAQGFPASDGPQLPAPEAPAPHDSRSRDVHAAAVQKAQLHCLSLATKVFESYSGPPAAAQYGSGAFLMSCVVKQMPDDWPDSDALRKHATDLADAARRADPEIDPCLLWACASETDAPDAPK
jgi:hypothetical protein